MPDEQDSQTPTGDANQDSSSESPIVALPKQSVMTNPSGQNSSNIQTETKKKLHWLEIGYFSSQIILAVIGIWALCIYSGQLTAMQGQLTQMQGSSKQTDRLLCLYQQQLAQLTKQASDTHNLAIASGDQAQATSNVADAASKQAAQALVQANATKKLSEISGNAMIVSNRPWIKVDLQQTAPLIFLPDGSAKIGIQQRIENVGSSVAVRVFSWFDIVPLGPLTNTFDAARARQKEWCDANRFPQSSMSGEEMFPHDQTINSYAAPIPKEHIVPLKEHGLEGMVGFALVGCVSYRSSFEDRRIPSHETRFEYWIAKPVPRGGVLPYVDPSGDHPDYTLVRVPDGLTAD